MQTYLVLTVQMRMTNVWRPTGQLLCKCAAGHGMLLLQTRAVLLSWGCITACLRCCEGLPDGIEELHLDVARWTCCIISAWYGPPDQLVLAHVDRSGSAFVIQALHLCPPMALHWPCHISSGRSNSSSRVQTTINK